MITNPHDLIVHALVGQPEPARGALHAIPPAALAEAFAGATPTLPPGRFVDSASRPPDHRVDEDRERLTWNGSPAEARFVVGDP